MLPPQVTKQENFQFCVFKKFIRRRPKGAIRRWCQRSNMNHRPTDVIHLLRTIRLLAAVSRRQRGRRQSHYPKSTQTPKQYQELKQILFSSCKKGEYRIYKCYEKEK